MMLWFVSYLLKKGSFDFKFLGKKSLSGRGGGDLNKLKNLLIKQKFVFFLAQNEACQT